MRKIAFFCEGQTEQVFVHRLIREYAGTRGATIEQRQFRGGGPSGPRIVLIKFTHVAVGPPDYYVQIYDCATDNRVVSDIKSRAAGLRQQGFELVVGIRDAAPEFSFADVERARTGHNAAANTGKPNGLDILVALAVMEVEAWFIDESSHFARFDPRLTAPLVQTALGYAPGSAQAFSSITPASDLAKVYAVVGRSYTKTWRQCLRTVQRLDYVEIHNSVRVNFVDLDAICSRLDGVFGP